MHQDTTTIWNENKRLVEHTAWSVYRRIPENSAVSLDELMSCGTLALLEATGNFDETMGVPFGAFVRQRVRGAMVDQLRRIDPLGRRKRNLVRLVKLTRSEMARELGRVPSAREVAARCDISLEQYWSGMSAGAFGPSENSDTETLADTRSQDPEQETAYAEVVNYLSHAVDELPERERYCVQQHYFEDRMMKDVASDLGVTTSRVSQILSGARRRLRRALSVHTDMAYAA